MIVISALALAAALPAGQTQDFRWTGTLSAGKTLEVSAVNGSLSATPASGNQIEVTAVKRGRLSDPASVEIKVEETAAGVTICTIYPQHQGSSCHNQRRTDAHKGDHKNDVSVAFEVRVPAAVRFEGHVVNGDARAMNLRSDVRISTVNGDVDVSSSGFAEASTVNGDVTATVGRADWAGSAKYSTVNGSVTVTLPASLNAEVRASTVNGGINTDFPLQVQGRFGPRSVRGTIGTGGRTLSLETVNGSIAIRKAS